MKFTDQDKNAVTCKSPINGQEWTVPRGHRFWVEWGIDTAEAQGRINEPETMAIDGSDSGSSNNGI
ncbi:hypothetical protein BCU71_07665 [Vibrio lentus]|uniref:hypothetical protein n=1 Tax=Vibrio lentus TaxID=136468 RepID=UPI000C85A723|nr:hypothetical protein [Vibrio lentus]PMH28432.1 hypothetical protein BCU71_07665 [Vibrio lentus]PMK70413.1 hypothetical protein BCT93_07300 [Vibrio lentus]